MAGYQRSNNVFNIENQFHPLQSQPGLINPYSVTNLTMPQTGHAPFSPLGGGGVSINPPGPTQPFTPGHTEPVLNPPGPVLPNNGVSVYSYTPGNDSVVSPVGHPLFPNGEARR